MVFDMVGLQNWGESGLIPGFDKRASDDVFQKLTELGVRVKLISPIFKVDQHFIELVTKERVAYDVLVWTAGVSALTISAQQPFIVDRRGHVETDEFLRAKGSELIFVVGDAGLAKDAQGKISPDTAQAAVFKGKYVAKALPVLMQNKKPAGFSFGGNPFIVAVGGKWGIFKGGGMYVTGFLPYLLRLGANIHYYASLIGWFKAVKYVLFQV